MLRTDSGLKYFSGGQGMEAVICHPSLGLGRFLFYRMLPSLSRRYRVFTYDPRGIGDNEALDPSLSAWVEDVGQLMEIADCPCHLIGVSLGTWVMSRAAVAWPDRMGRLVLMGATREFEDGVQQVQARRQELSQTPGSMEDFARRYADSTLADFVDGELKEQLIVDMTTCDPQRYLSAMAEIYLTSNAAVFPRIKVPTLIVVGTRDTRTSPADADAAASLIPKSQVRVVPDAGHLALLDQPRRIQDLVEAFLATGELDV